MHATLSLLRSPENARPLDETFTTSMKAHDGKLLFVSRQVLFDYSVEGVQCHVQWDGVSSCQVEYLFPETVSGLLLGTTMDEGQGYMFGEDVDTMLIDINTAEEAASYPVFVDFMHSQSVGPGVTLPGELSETIQSVHLDTFVPIKLQELFAVAGTIEPNV